MKCWFSRGLDAGVGVASFRDFFVETEGFYCLSVVVVFYTGLLSVRRG